MALPRPTADATPIEEASFVVLDFETTTVAIGRASYPEPIELAAMRLGPGMTVDRTFTFSSLIKPPAHAPVTPFVSNLTGIKQRDLEGAPGVGEVLGMLHARLKETPSLLVAHHAPFDAGVLWRHVQHCPAAASASFLDSCELARRLVPGLPKYGLDSLCGHYAVELPRDRHRALADVELTVGVWLRLMEAARGRGLRTIGELRSLAGLATPRFRTTRFQDSLFPDEAVADGFARELEGDAAA